MEVDDGAYDMALIDVSKTETRRERREDGGTGQLLAVFGSLVSGSYGAVRAHLPCIGLEHPLWLNPDIVEPSNDIRVPPKAEVEVLDDQVRKSVAAIGDRFHCRRLVDCHSTRNPINVTAPSAIPSIGRHGK